LQNAATRRLRSSARVASTTWLGSTPCRGIVVRSGRRLPARRYQIAATHLYLMENRFVTGTVLTVDGGFVLTGS
jgi:NAD(P)-dependent dehydrogenase (short-subunit alcohol dehydrogenase family)